MAKLEGPIEFDTMASLANTEFAANAVITKVVRKNNRISLIVPKA
jgi:hypothetical protein